MNCEEAQVLVDDELDKTLKGWRKKHLDLHLSRCAMCRALFATTRAEHARWFRALNEPAARHRLPSSFVARLPAICATRPQRWRRQLTCLRRIAALLAMAGTLVGVAFAAKIGLTASPVDYNEEEDASPVKVPTDGSSSVTEDLEMRDDSSWKGNAMTNDRLLKRTRTVAITLAATGALASSGTAAALLSEFEGVVSYPMTFASQCTSTPQKFLSRASTRGSDGVGTFLSRYRTTETSPAVASFDSTEPSGFVLIIR